MTAAAQSNPTYKLVDLGTLGNEGDEDSRAYGVNAFGEVVGESGVDGEPIADKGRAFVWLPEARLGLPQGMTNLGVASAAVSVARDLNDHLHVVGILGVEGLGQSFLWTPVAFDDIPAMSLYELPGATGFDNQAWKITNDPGPDQHQWVAGENINGCGNTNGYIWKSEAPLSVTLLDPPMGSPGPNTGAYAINPAGVTGSLTRTAGFSDKCTWSAICGSFNSGATTWASTVPQLLPVPMGLQTDSAARDITDAGVSCGWWEDPSIEADCARHAMLWVGVAPTNLHDEAEIPADEESVAEALNASSEIVGSHMTDFLQSAVLWRFDNMQEIWTVTDLNEEIHALCGFRVEEAHGINEEGWISGVGDANPTGGAEIRAYLLIPFEDIDCPEDVDRDGDIDQDDLDQVINTSNQTPSCEAGRICWEDVNGDCLVNITDIKRVMRAFGPCGGTGTELSEYDLDMWLAAGGAVRIAEETLPASAIAASLDRPTLPERIVRLYANLVE